LPTATVRYTTEDDKGRLWVATAQGIARSNSARDLLKLNVDPANNFTSFKIRSGDSLIEKVSNQANRIVFHPDGSMWVLTDYGLYKTPDPDAKELIFTAVISKDTAFSGGVLKDKNGDIWLGVADELVQVRGAEVINHGSIGIPFPKNFISAIERDKTGRLLVSDIKDVFEFLPPGESRLKGEFRKIYSVKGNVRLHHLFVDEADHLWIATAKGLIRLTDDGATKYEDFGDVVSPSIVALTADRDGSLWVSTGNDGVKRLLNKSILNYVSVKQDLKTVGEIVEDSVGDLRFGLPDGSSAMIEKGKFIEQKIVDMPVNSSPSVWFEFIRITSSPDTWFLPTKPSWFFAAENGLIKIASPKLRLRNGQTIDVTKYIDTTTPGGARFYEDENETLWIAKREKTVRRGMKTRDGSYTFDDIPVEANYGYGSRIISDGNGGIWLATYPFVGRIRNGKYSPIQISDGLPERNLLSVFKDSRGWLWIGLRNSGVSMTKEPAADEPVFLSYSKSNSPISSKAVRSITEDDQGRMYFATDLGINRFDISKNEWTLFSSRNGLAGDLTFGVFKDINNVIWAATNGGLSRIDPNIEKSGTDLPPIYLTGVNIAGKNLSLPETGLAEISGLELDSAENNLTFNFVAPHFNAQNLLYQHFLEGADRHWSKPSQDRTASFSLLPAGKYRFYVRTVDPNGTVGSRSAFFEFQIMPPIWQRWWFILGAITLLGLAAFRLYRFRLSQLLEVERTRTRIATDLHDDIGTNLAKISLLSEIIKMQLSDKSDKYDKNEERNRMLEVIGETSRESVGAMSDIVWAINPQKDTLSDMIRRMRQYAEEILLEKPVNLKFSSAKEYLDLKLTMDIRRELYLIYKEAITNAAKHSCCENIEVTLELKASELYLKVKDDGIGFDINQPENGNGLQNLRKRADRIRANLKIESNVGSGTSVTVNLQRK
jgi:signal transduction histidine kinase/ligand-binding sensor domain-containing protein